LSFHYKFQSSPYLLFKQWWRKILPEHDCGSSLCREGLGLPVWKFSQTNYWLSGWYNGHRVDSGRSNPRFVALCSEKTTWAQWRRSTVVWFEEC